ncbi:hypothetical protein I4U23_004642 [Adineta vaga]|nr:hypothetical protein I4U23_004642 [Adineta vaga]
MLDNENKKIGFPLTLLTVIAGIVGCLVSCIVLILIIHNLCYNRSNRQDKIVLILCINIYIWIFMVLIIFTSMNIKTILGDLYGQDFDSSGCIFLGYLSMVSGGLVYITFINQAFFRLCRIVYTQYRWLQFYWLYVIIPPFQVILLCVLLCPLLIWVDIIYLPTENYCYFHLSNVRVVAWAGFICYGIPLLCLLLIYTRITIYLRQQTNNQRISIKRRQERDLVAIRRIFIVFSMLATLGLPNIILLIMFFMTGEEHPLSLRIEFVSMTISFAALTVGIVLSTSQLKKIIFKRGQRNQVIPFNGSLAGSIPMRAINT